MFGYIVVHKPELKIREYEAYQASYCGLCQSLRRRHGKMGQMTLSFDMTFLALLLTGLYEPRTRTGVRRCPAHPLKNHPFRENSFYDYAADMNVLLTYYKCLDDWMDERKLRGLVYARLLSGKMKKIRGLYTEKVQRVEQLLSQLQRLEQKNICDIDKTAGFFGEIMAELFVCREDEWEEKLRRMGFFFGKFIYLMDAYEDIEGDLEAGRYNPLAKLYETGTFEQDCAQILKMMMSETSRTFELLPVLRDAEILRNILYAGVWTRYARIRCERKEKEKERSHDDRSI